MKETIKNILFVITMYISKFFGWVGKVLLNISNVIENKAYFFRPRLCADNDICLNRSLTAFYKYTKNGQKLLNMGVTSKPMTSSVYKVGELNYELPSCIDNKAGIHEYVYHKYSNANNAGKMFIDTKQEHLGS